MIPLREVTYPIWKNPPQPFSFRVGEPDCGRIGAIDQRATDRLQRALEDVAFDGVADIPHSDAIEAEIRKRAEKLDAFSDHVMHCEVSVGSAGKHHTQGRMYEVHIDLTVSGTEIVINRVHRHEDVYVVIRDAFEAAVRKLQDFVREQRGDVKVHETPLHGRVAKLFEDGYGFVETPDGTEFYFQRDNLAYPEFDQLQVGMDVEFLQQVAGEGMQAKRVTAGRHHIPGMP